MSILQAIVLGAIQGLTEFLPISSSGHLILVPEFLGWELQPLAFDAMVHMGTLLAVIIYFKDDVLKLITLKDKPLAKMVVIGIVPAGLVGFFLNDIIETTFRSTNVVIASLIIWGLFLIAADRYSKKVKQPVALTNKKSLLIGLAQIISLVPGTSRSGITIGTGIFTKLSAKEAARFSFLMSIPLIAGAGLFKLLDLSQGEINAIGSLPLLIGLITSAIVGYFAIRLLMHLLNSQGLTIFGIYRIILALGLIIL